ncbi:dipeptide epimerase [Clostridium sp. AM58-1XD]|uniref:mandelate racemase/muconate lactonizing enzyme family protein n=1 Tax=Clostridium sp. AM58-1XD TaxID=2292307 RepID=UPI000E548AD4|nr:dipeptide epimerase [Clostridium sp. AM58-1XD]RGZ01518.1 dipeptide epimerase [Clostridium sp. AM58-1XD]
MKITNVEVKKVKVPLIEPFRISLGVITHAISAVVKIETDEGLVGYGEGAPGVLITGENLDGTIAEINMLADKLKNTDPTDMEAVYWVMDRASAHAPCGKTAIDIACHDLLGKKAGLPVYKLLGGYEGTIDTDMTVGLNDAEVMASKAAKHVAAGFDTIKTKVGTGLESDIARVKAIREAVGPDVKIRLDANQGWTAKEAVNIIERLNEYDIELVEQPVPYYDIAGLEYVTKNTKVLIMADESCFTAKDALRLAERRAVDLVNIKLMKCGGIREAQKINAVCEAAGIQCMLGCMGEETNIGVTAAASLGAATRNITRADLDATFSLSELPFKGGMIVENAKHIILPEEPGFGFRGFEEA